MAHPPVLRLAWLAALAVTAACSGSGSGKQCGSGVICGATDGGYDAGAAFSITKLPTNGAHPDFSSPSFAVDLASDGRIGIAYFWDVNQTDRELDYLELETDGSTKSTKIDVTQRLQGLSMAFDRGGTPQIAYLGQDPTMPPPAEVDGGGIVFWLQANLAVATIHSFVDGGVQHTYPAHVSADVSYPGDPNVAIEGTVVGLFPAIAAVDAGLIVTYRDIHFGQFPVGDYGDSSWDSAVGAAAEPYTGPPSQWDGSDIRIERGDSQTLLVHGGLGSLAKIAVGQNGIGAICSGEANLDATPTDIFFAYMVDGGWIDQEMAESVNNVGSAGGSLAADPAGGFALSWVEMEPGMTSVGSPILYYTTTTDESHWANPEEVYGSGSGGWEPSLAFDSSQLPNVAYYVCAQEPGEATCPPSEQGLWVSTRRAAGVWGQQLVDPAGGRMPILHFDGQGNMVLIYQDPATGSLKMAVPAPP